MTTTERPNVLLVTLDQWRGDCLGAAGHPLVQTPHLDALAAAGVRFARHYSQASPCAPGRASLYTGTYQMNHRVVANGTPLDDRFDNVARVARRAGYRPALFGYTDQGVDPRTVGAGDPRLSTYEGVLPGFDAVLDTGGADRHAWTAWLRSLGHDVPDEAEPALVTEPSRHESLSLAAFLTDRLLDWVDGQDEPWFAHASYWRPHPPYAAAGRFARMYDPADVALPVAGDDTHPLHAFARSNAIGAAPQSERDLRELRAQYLGMVSEADSQIGRVCAHLQAIGQWDRTVVVVTSDHGDQLGDHGLIGKLLQFEQSYHVPAIVRDPRRRPAHGSVVHSFTENVDVLPTVCDLVGVPAPAQCDGHSLVPFLDGRTPERWRTGAHWEFDWRFLAIRGAADDRPVDRRLESMNLCTLRTERALFTQFADGSTAAADLAADPAGTVPLTDRAALLDLATELLSWRMQHADRTLTGMLLQQGGEGRRPDPPAKFA